MHEATAGFDISRIKAKTSPTYKLSLRKIEFEVQIGGLWTACKLYSASDYPLGLIPIELLAG